VTVLGFHVEAPHRAFAWCDSEVFAEEDVPTGDKLKLAVNSLAACVIVGTGRWGPFRDVADDLLLYQTFDEAIAALPQAMRRASRAFSALEIAARAPLRSQLFAAVGFSHRYGRIVGASFNLADDFEPIFPRNSLTSPDINGAAHVLDEHSAISAAHNQLAELKASLPAATGGALVLAEVTPGGVRCGPIFDFRAGKMLGRGWHPPPCSTT
jgi:hypothetical protein